MLWMMMLPAVQIVAAAQEPPVIPVGLDAYRMWDKWAYLRIGQRTYMTSTYDRTGANEYADASHFLYQLADDRNVSLDVMGPSVLAFARYNHWHGSPWHYIIDGNDHIVQESSSPDPDHPKPNSVFIPEEQFPNPLTWTWSTTKGADLMWVPLPFGKSFAMAYERTHYGTGYYIYHKFAPGTKHLSRPIKSWNMDAPPRDVLDLINRAGQDIAPTGDTITALSGRLQLMPNETKELATITKAPSTIRAIKFVVPEDQAEAFSKARVRITWDGGKRASVDAPINLFFGTGSIYNREKREYLVKAFPVNVRFAGGSVRFACYFPMPFHKKARIEIEETQGKPIEGVDWSIRFEPYNDPPNWVGYFHATYVDHGEPTLGHDLIFLDTTKVEGGGDWCGHIVGTSFIFSDRAVLNTLEGDPRFFFDDSQTPQVQGTGTEEWCGGGDYWGGRTMTLPFAGHPTGASNAKEAQCEEDKINSAYRFLLSDLMPFGKNARVGLEHGGENLGGEHYRSVTFWYGVNKPCLVRTDELHVGDPADEKKHEYDSPNASRAYEVTSRYEWGIDYWDGKEIFSATSDTGRFTKTQSSFTLSIDPKNVGVMLRRKFDYSFPNQMAKVLVADVDPRSEWKEVGLWYTAGSNTIVYSNPPEETGAAQHIVQTSNRRWRDDEFLLPRELTEGRSAIRIKVEFVPRNIPLFPGHPMAEQAWSEFRYWAYSVVMPRAD